MIFLFMIESVKLISSSFIRENLNLSKDLVNFADKILTL